MLPYPAQLELVNALLTYPRVAQELQGVAKAIHLPESPGLGLLLETGLGLWEKYKAPPTKGQIREAIQGHPNEPNAVSVLEDVFGSSVPDEAWAIEKGRKHVAEAELVRLAGETKMLLADGQHEKILSRVKDSLAIMSPRGEVTYGAGTTDEILARHVTGMSRIPTRILDLDSGYLNGGLGRGRTGCIIGKKGGGKSHALVWLGAAGLLGGYRVLYITLEMSGSETRARFDRSLTGLSSQLLSQQIHDLYPSLVDLHSRLTIVEASRRPLSVHGLMAVLDRQPKDKRPDLIVLDYYQRLATSGGGDDPAKSRISDLTVVSKTLHEIAQTWDAALWTAHQANRSGIDAMLNQGGVLTTVHASEAINAMWDFDVVMSINQTIAEEVDRTMRLFVCENRDGPSGSPVQCLFRKDVSRIEGRM